MPPSPTLPLSKIREAGGILLYCSCISISTSRNQRPASYPQLSKVYSSTSGSPDVSSPTRSVLSPL